MSFLIFFVFLFLFLSCSRCSSSPSVVANTDGLGDAVPNFVNGRVDVGVGAWQQSQVRHQHIYVAERVEAETVIAL